MNYEGIELRELERFTEPHIPEILKSLKCDLGTDKLITATTTDFNTKGIRLLLPEPIEFEKNDGIILVTIDDNIRLVGEVMHHLTINNETTYVGIRLLRNNATRVYSKIIEKALSRKMV